MTGPRRIVCLTEEPTEVLYALGEQERIVGISGFTVRPAIARKQKPKVSAFTSAKIDEILKLQPDFVVGFSDIQADIAAELIRIAGGDDIFPERALEPLAKARILEDAGEVIRRAPDIILGSWCGKKFRPEKVAARADWDAIPAVRDGQLFEVKSPIILQPGPAALTDGVAEIARIIREWSKEEGAE